MKLSRTLFVIAPLLAMFVASCGTVDIDDPKPRHNQFGGRGAGAGGGNG